MRYYTTTAGEMVLQSGIAPSDTTISVDTTAGLPGSFPYTLLLDYGTVSEEVVDVTAAAGTTLTVTRGRDGTVAQSHAFGAKIRHGVTARDFRESREHEAATAAHGVATVAGLTETQTFDNKTFQPAADNTALTLRSRSGNTAPLAEVQDSGGASRGKVTEEGLFSVFSGSNWASLYWGGAINVFKQVLSLRIASDVHGLVGSVVSGATGRFLRLMSGATELFYVSASGALKATSGLFDSLTVNGAVTANSLTMSGPINAGSVAVSAGGLTVTNNATVGGSTTLSGTLAVTGATTGPLADKVTALETADTLTSSACAYGSGFAIATTGPDPIAVKRGGLVSISAKIRRTSGTGTTAFTVPAGYRPNAAYTPNVGLSVQAWNGGTVEGPGFIATVDSTGVVNLSQIDNGKAWDAGTFIQITGSYFA